MRRHVHRHPVLVGQRHDRPVDPADRELRRPARLHPDPGLGYHSDTVTGTCGGSLVGNTFTTAAVTANCTVIANFAINTYTVTPSSSGNGTIAPSTPQVVNYGAQPVFTLTPAVGYHSLTVTRHLRRLPGR